jgi:hypothetical protein
MKLYMAVNTPAINPSNKVRQLKATNFHTVGLHSSELTVSAYTMRCVQNAASATHVFANKEVAVARITNAISVERSTRMNHHRGVGVQ